MKKIHINIPGPPKIIVVIVAIIIINMLFEIFKYAVPSVSPDIYTPYKMWISALLIFSLFLNKVGGFNI